MGRLSEKFGPAKPRGSGFVGEIDPTRPMLPNDDGSYSTERTMTFEVDGRHLVIPSIVNGERLDADRAFEAWKEGRNPEVGSFPTAEEAEAYSRKRSSDIDAVRQPRRGRLREKFGTVNAAKDEVGFWEALGRRAKSGVFTTSKYAGALATVPAIAADKLYGLATGDPYHTALQDALFPYTVDPAQRNIDAAALGVDEKYTPAGEVGGVIGDVVGMVPEMLMAGPINRYALTTREMTPEILERLSLSRPDWQRALPAVQKELGAGMTAASPMTVKQMQMTYDQLIAEGLDPDLAAWAAGTGQAPVDYVGMGVPLAVPGGPLARTITGGAAGVIGGTAADVGTNISLEGQGANEYVRDPLDLQARGAEAGVASIMSLIFGGRPGIRPATPPERIEPTLLPEDDIAAQTSLQMEKYATELEHMGIPFESPEAFAYVEQRVRMDKAREINAARRAAQQQERIDLGEEQPPMPPEQVPEQGVPDVFIVDPEGRVGTEGVDGTKAGALAASGVEGRTEVEARRAFDVAEAQRARKQEGQDRGAALVYDETGLPVERPADLREARAAGTTSIEGTDATAPESFMFLDVERDRRGNVLRTGPEVTQIDPADPRDFGRGVEPALEVFYVDPETGGDVVAIVPARRVSELSRPRSPRFAQDIEATAYPPPRGVGTGPDQPLPRRAGQRITTEPTPRFGEDVSPRDIESELREGEDVSDLVFDRLPSREEPTFPIVPAGRAQVRPEPRRRPVESQALEDPRAPLRLPDPEAEAPEGDIVEGRRLTRREQAEADEARRAAEEEARYSEEVLGNQTRRTQERVDRVRRARQMDEAEEAIFGEAEPDEAVTTVERPDEDAPQLRHGTFLGTLRGLGGVDAGVARDITGETAQVSGRRLPGLFKRDGRGLDDIATALYERGWISEQDYNDVDGGVQAVRDLIDAAIRGEEVLHPEDQMSRFEYEAAQRGYADALEEFGLEVSDDNRRRMELEERAQEELSADVREDIAVRAGDDDIAYYDMLEDALNARQETDTGDQTRGRLEEEAEGEALSESLLEAYGQEDLEARDRRRRIAEEQDRAEQERLRKKEQADAEREGFELTGSDRPADAQPRQRPLSDADEAMSRRSKEKYAKDLADDVAFIREAHEKGEVSDDVLADVTRWAEEADPESRAAQRMRDALPKKERGQKSPWLDSRGEISRVRRDIENERARPAELEEERRSWIADDDYVVYTKQPNMDQWKKIGQDSSLGNDLYERADGKRMNHMRDMGIWVREKEGVKRLGEHMTEAEWIDSFDQRQPGFKERLRKDDPTTYRRAFGEPTKAAKRSETGKALPDAVKSFTDKIKEARQRFVKKAREDKMAGARVDALDMQGVDAWGGEELAFQVKSMAEKRGLDVRKLSQAIFDAWQKPNAPKWQQKASDPIGSQWWWEQVDPATDTIKLAEEAGIKPKSDDDLGPGTLRSGLSPKDFARVIQLIVGKGWGEKFREFKKDVADVRQESRASANPVKNGAKWLFETSVGHIRSKIAPHDSEWANRVIDHFHADAGGKRAVEQTFPEAVTTWTNKQLNKVGRVLTDMDEQQVAAIVNKIRNPRSIQRGRSAIDNAAAEIRAALDDALKYMREAGVDVGEVKYGYFPREFDLGLVSKKGAEFKQAAERAYRQEGLSGKDAKAAAEELWETLVFGGDDSLFKPDRGSAAPFLKGRVFGKQVDDTRHPLNKFLVNDATIALPQYFQRVARRAEIAKRFGDRFEWWHGLDEKTAVGRGMSKGDYSRLPEWKKRGMKKMMIDEDLPENVIGDVEDFISMAAGLRNTGTNKRIARFSSMARTYTTMMYLEKATLSSLAEFATPAIRAGNWGMISTSLKNTVMDLAKAGDSKRLREFGEDLGLLSGHFMDAFNSARFAGGDVIGLKQTKVLDRYFRRIGLTQWTEATRVASIGAGQVFLRRLSKDKLAGKDKNLTTRYLAELGVPPEKQDAFAKWVLSKNDGQLRADDVTGDIGAQYRTAVTRFMNQSIMAPDAIQKPKWANSPLGSIIAQLQSFNYAFYENVWKRAGRMTKAALTDKTLTTAERWRAAQPMLMMPVLMTVAGLVGEARDALFGFYDEDQDPVDRLVKAFSRGTPLAPVDPFINWLTGARYKRKFIESFVGPGIGALARGADAVGEYFTNNSPLSNKSERKVAKEFYNLVLEPSLNILMTWVPGPQAAAATQFLGSQKAKNLFVDVVAGEEKTKKKKKPYWQQ